MMIYHDYSLGRIDYVFIERDVLNSTYYNIKISVCIKSEQSSEIDIFVDNKTKIGQVLADISSEFEISNLLDFRLILTFNGVERILDQD